MDLPPLLPWLLLTCVSVVFVGLASRLRQDLTATRLKLEAATKDPPPVKKLDVTAQDLLHDLTARGNAILRVTVLDPSAVLLRSPRE